MRRENNHIGDAELLSALDGELSVERRDRVREHVALCPACRSRIEKFADATKEFNRLCRAADNTALVPHASSRADLRRRIALGGHSPASSTWLPQWLARFPVQAGAFACILALVLVAFAEGWLDGPNSRDASNAYRDLGGPVLPDARLTPGVTRPVTASQICFAGGPTEEKPPIALQRAVFHEYGMDGAPARDYEVDHLITPALGGTDDIGNLWPEPYASTEWNAHVKDELEDHLHSLVCDGKLDLATAQRDMASNWILAYKKYFHADQPLPRTSDLLEGRRWPKG